jgi:hypothetical protein
MPARTPPMPGKIITKLDQTLASFNSIFQNDITKLRHAIQPNEIWRFFIDGDRQQEGWLKFEETEPGYLMAMVKAYQRIFASAADIEALAIELHAIASSEVKNLIYDRNVAAGENRNSYRKNNIYLPGIVRSTCTPDGIAELISTIINYPEQTDYPVLQLFDREKNCGMTLLYRIPPSFVFRLEKDNHAAADKKENNTESPASSNIGSDFNDLIHLGMRVKLANNPQSINLFMPYVNQYLDSPNKHLQLSHYHGNGETVDEKVAEAMSIRMKSYVNEYKQSILAATNPYDKLKSIVYFIRNCERLHPFVDANTRTFSMLLLNHLLIQNGFVPVIRTDPNKCYAITIDEFIDDIIDGMDRTLKLAQGVDPYNVKTADIVSKLDAPGLAVFSQAIAIEANSHMPTPSNDAKTAPSTATLMPISVSSSSVPSTTTAKAEDKTLSLEERKKLRDTRIIQKFTNNTELSNLGKLTPSNFNSVVNHLFSNDAKLEFISLCEPYYNVVKYDNLKLMLTGLPLTPRLIILSKWMEAQDKTALSQLFTNSPKAKNEILAIMKLSQARDEAKDEARAKNSIFKSHVHVMGKSKIKEECISSDMSAKSALTKVR